LLLFTEDLRRVLLGNLYLDRRVVMRCNRSKGPMRALYEAWRATQHVARLDRYAGSPELQQGHRLGAI
jgi:hypothetical protein